MITYRHLPTDERVAYTTRCVNGTVEKLPLVGVRLLLVSTCPGCGADHGRPLRPPGVEVVTCSGCGTRYCVVIPTELR